MSTPRVLTPYTFPRTGKTIRNRTVLAAMTNKQSHADGTLSDDEFEWLGTDNDQSEGDRMLDQLPRPL